MTNFYCALGCSQAKDLYVFPSRKYDTKRRKAWLDFFDLEEPNVNFVFACEKHFSHLQISQKRLITSAVPDIPIICNDIALPFKRKPKNWRKNVIVVTPRDPEFSIYRHETGVFPQQLFDISNTVQPAIQVPIIKSVSCSMSTQTNTRLCGLVEISNVKEEYHLNCFYCSEMFALEKWKIFVDHLKKKHYREEEAFKMSNCLLQDHDYTTSSRSTVKLPSNTYKIGINSFVQASLAQPVFLEPILLPPLLVKPKEDVQRSMFKSPESLPPLLSAKPPPNYSNDKKVINISLADQVIKLLNETILNPIFVPTEDDNILIIKNTGSDIIETSNFLTDFMNFESSCDPIPQKATSGVKSKNPIKTTLSSKNTRPIYTIKHGEQDVPSRRNSLSETFPSIPRNRIKRFADRTLKNINAFENIYRTVKKRPPKADATENIITNNLNSTNVNERKISYVTPVSRFLKRIITQKTEREQPKNQKSIEIVFEYTPREIIVLLLESMKNYPVLWDFHDKPFNKEYNKAIEELCKIINDKWALNITAVKMRRSVIRILRFYRFMLPRESIDQFEEYFDKCALYLPSSVDAIPRARCAYCCICYKKDSDLRKHTKEQHKSLKWSYKCQHCLERFRESDEYELHKRLPHYEEIYKCQYCDKRFSRRNRFNQHVDGHKKFEERRKKPPTQVVTFERYMQVCDVCKQEFKYYHELQRHKKSHEEIIEDKFKCNICSKQLCSNTSLKFHMKRHRKELDFICEVCGKGFIRQASLIAHMDTHTGAKITCNICNLRLRKCSLLRHLRLVHIVTEGTIESTFRAKSYRYNKFSYMTQNRKRTKGETPRQYNCKTCKLTLNNLKQLKDHNKLVHANVKKTPCKICNLEFIHLQNLKRHYRCKHKLHRYQIFKLVDLNEEDVQQVLEMTTEELEAATEFDYLKYIQNKQDKLNEINNYPNNNFEQTRMHSDAIQDEIMKAVENIDNREIRVDDDHAMHEFFTDLFSKNS